MKEVQEARRIKMLHQPSKVCAGSLVKILLPTRRSSYKTSLFHFSMKYGEVLVTYLGLMTVLFRVFIYFSKPIMCFNCISN
jgi:hypothetical protein